ncbi:MAG: hypothetical protein HG424_003200 [candidate division SR1 bacterium]|nr:hypothetical protein [candidate division SR1 bacterium]
MNTKTTQEIFREKHKDILASLNQLRIRYSSSVVAFIIIIICTTLEILSTGNKLVFFVIILIFVIALTILVLVSFFKNLRYLKEHKEHLMAMETELHYIADTEDFEEIKKLISFYNELGRHPKALYIRELFLNFYVNKKEENLIFLPFLTLYS